MPDVNGNFTDQEVVAAFNSCFDSKKYFEMPNKVRQRFEKLMKHHRVKLVCFSAQDGFGLRVYTDDNLMQDDMEEDQMTCRPSFSEVDLEGKWVRCPPSLLAKVPQTPNCIVVDGKITGYIKTLNCLDEASAMGNEYMDAGDYSAAWTLGVGMNSRNTAKKFTEDDAKKIAAMFGGHVVKK